MGGEAGLAGRPHVLRNTPSHIKKSTRRRQHRAQPRSLARGSRAQGTVAPRVAFEFECIYIHVHAVQDEEQAVQEMEKHIGMFFMQKLMRF